MFELAQRLYAQMPLAALSLAGLGVALVWLILKSFLAMCFGKPVPEDAWAGPLPPGQVRHDWLRGGGRCLCLVLAGGNLGLARGTVG